MAASQSNPVRPGDVITGAYRVERIVGIARVGIVRFDGFVDCPYALGSGDV